MSQSQEELVVRLGLDSSKMAQDLRAAKRVSDTEGQGFMKKHAEGFLHAESAGRKFHGLMDKITESSPIFGNALRLAISPIVGMFTVAGAAISIAKSALDKFNASLDETGRINAMGTGAKPESATAKFYRELHAAKDFSEATASGKPAFNPLQAIRLENARKAAEGAQKLADANINLETRNMPEGTSGLNWLSAFDPAAYGRAFTGAAGAVRRWGWLSALNPRNSRRSLALDESEALARRSRLMALRGQAADAGLHLQNAEPPGKTSTPVDIFAGLNLDQAVIMTARLAVAGKRYLDNLPKQIDLDSATGGIAYKGLAYRGIPYNAIPGATGWTPPNLSMAGGPAATTATDIKSMSSNMGDILKLAQTDGLIIKPRMGP